MGVVPDSFILKRCSQLAVYAIQPVWLVENGVHPVLLFPGANVVSFGTK